MRSARSLSVVSVLVVAAFTAGCSKSASEYMTQGKDLFAKKDYKGAALDFRSAVAKQPRLSDAHEQLANAYFALGDYAAAVKEYVRAADLRPDDEALQVKASQYLLLTGQAQDAKTRVDAVLQKNPGNVDARLVQARAMFALKDLNGAVAQVEKMLANPSSDDAAAYANLGSFQMAQGKPADAEAAFKKAVAAAPTSIYPRLSLASFYWDTDRLDDAEATLNGALKLDPQNVLTNRLLAVVLIRAKKPAEAEAPLKIVADHSDNPNAKFILANYYIRSGREKDATALLTELQKNNDTYVSATIALAGIAQSHKDLGTANRLVDEALAKSPKNVLALLAKSGLLASAGKLPEAIDEAKAAVAADARSAEAEFDLGTLYASTHNVDGAIAALNAGVKLEPAAGPPKLTLAKMFLAKGDSGSAVSLAQQATAGPHPMAAELVLVEALLAHNDVDAAAQRLAKFPAAYAKVPEVLVEEGNLAWKRNDAKDAKRLFTEALAADPANRNALNGLIAATVADKDIPGAQALVQHALAKTPNDGQLLLVLGNLSLMKGDSAGAETAYKKAIAVSPALLDAYQRLGSVYVKENKLPEALADFEQAADKTPNSVSAQTAVAMLLEMQNKPDEAQKRYEKALQIDPRAAVAANNLAWIYTANGGNLDVALQLAQTAKSELPDALEVDDTLGWIYVKKGLPGLAIPPLEDCARKDPSNPEFLFHLGMAYAKAGDRSKARDTLNKAIATGTQFDGIAEAKQTVSQLKG